MAYLLIARKILAIIVIIIYDILIFFRQVFNQHLPLIPPDLLVGPLLR